MTTQNKGASRTRGAPSSRNGKAPTINYRGLTLTLPSDPPGDLAFSIENNEASAAVQEIFGDDQYTSIREALKAEKLSLQQTFEALAELLRSCFNEWGITEGE